MEQVLVELLKIIKSQDSSLTTIDWAKTQFEDIKQKMDKKE